MSTDTDEVKIPEKKRTNPFAEDTFLHDLYGDVLRQNRDLIILVSDARARRGTGKTVASLNLASNLDQTPMGLTWDKCTLSPEELRNAYATQPNGSALVLDEAEQAASNREAMTLTNRALREIFSMGRVREKYVVVNTPVKGFVDKDILTMTDVWIAMTRRGQGLVHALKWEPYSETLLTEKKQWLDLEDIETGTTLRNVYQKLTREKNRRIDGEDANAFVPQGEHNEELDRARETARKDERNEFVKSVYEHPEIDVTQQELAESIGVSQKTISNIIRGEFT